MVAAVGIWINLSNHVSLQLRFAQGARPSDTHVQVCGTPVALRKSFGDVYSYEGRMPCEGEISVDLIDRRGRIRQHRICYLSGVGTVHAVGSISANAIGLTCR